MLSKASIALLASATLAHGVVAANPHRRHAHQHVHEKKAIEYLKTEIEVVTEWVTVTFDPNAPVSMFAPGQHSEKVLSTSSSSTSTSTTSSSTSSTTSTTPTTTSTSSVFVAPVPTTLVTSSAAPAPAPAAETPDINIQVAASVEIAVTTPAAVAPIVVSTPAAEPEPAATTPAAVPSSSGGKRGFAYNLASLAAPLLGGSKITWGYNWGQTSDGLDDALEFVPMLWSPGSDHSSTWSANAKKAIAAGAKNLLGFNEPDNTGQANMSPAQAAADHITYMNPFAGQARISSPAITNSGNPGEGIEWLNSWKDACGGKCVFDFCAMHWYSPANAKEFLEHAYKVHVACDNKNVWITEFAPFGDDDTINKFLLDVMDQMDNNATYAFIERYSYFMLSEGSLVSGGIASLFGKSYAFS